MRFGGILLPDGVNVKSVRLTGQVRPVASGPDNGQTMKKRGMDMKKGTIVFACLILILSILPADALDGVFETNDKKEILPAPEPAGERNPETQTLSPALPEKIKAQRTLSNKNDLNPDYGNTVTVNIENEQDLLKILNGAGEKRDDGQGKRIKNVYTLTKNITLNASDLEETYFISATRLNSVILYDCIDGKNKTITINVDTPGPARSGPPSSEPYQ